MTADESPGKYDRFTITYAGSFYMDRTPEPLFAALGALVQDGKALPDDVCIKLIGSCHYIGAVETRVVARRYGVERSVEIIERVPHAEAIRVMSSISKCGAYGVLPSVPTTMCAFRLFILARLRA